MTVATHSFLISALLPVSYIRIDITVERWTDLLMKVLLLRIRTFLEEWQLAIIGEWRRNRASSVAPVYLWLGFISGTAGYTCPAYDLEFTGDCGNFLKPAWKSK